MTLTEKSMLVKFYNKTVESATAALQSYYHKKGLVMGNPGKFEYRLKSTLYKTESITIRIDAKILEPIFTQISTKIDPLH